MAAPSLLSLWRNQFHSWKIRCIARYVAGQDRPPFGLCLRANEKIGQHTALGAVLLAILQKGAAGRVG